MAFSYHRFMFVGNVTQLPIVTLTKGGTPMGRMAMAVNDTFKDKQGVFRKKASFFTVIFWDGFLIKRLEKLEVGDMVMTEGEIDPFNYVNKEGKKVNGFNFRGLSLIAPQVSKRNPTLEDEHEEFTGGEMTEDNVRNVKKWDDASKSHVSAKKPKKSVDEVTPFDEVEDIFNNLDL